MKCHGDMGYLSGNMEVMAFAVGCGCVPSHRSRTSGEFCSTQSFVFLVRSRVWLPSASIIFSCAEACSRLCTFGSVYKDKKGLPFDSLVKAFIEEFRLPPKGFPESEEAALAGGRGEGGYLVCTIAWCARSVWRLRFMIAGCFVSPFTVCHRTKMP